jgi:putative glutamine amidotransferase
MNRSKRKPLIGVTGPDYGGWLAWKFTHLAIKRVGGRALRITPKHPATIDLLDGLVIGGGADVDPRLYHEKRLMPEIRKQVRREMRAKWKHHRLTVWSVIDFTSLVLLWLLRLLFSTPWHHTQKDESARDVLELKLAREAIGRDIPVLGICRGMQLLNVALGGTLFQEITIFYEESPHLTTLIPRKKVEILCGSHLHEVFHRTMVRVNSLHFQSVRKLGAGLRATAREPNGVIQAIEHTDARHLIGVQWHPEYLPLRKNQQRLFKSLVDAAKKDSQTSFRRLVFVDENRERDQRYGNRNQESPTVSFPGIS